MKTKLIFNKQNISQLYILNVPFFAEFLKKAKVGKKKSVM